MKRDWVAICETNTPPPRINMSTKKRSLSSNHGQLAVSEKIRKRHYDADVKGLARVKTEMAATIARAIKLDRELAVEQIEMRQVVKSIDKDISAIWNKVNDHEVLDDESDEMAFHTQSLLSLEEREDRKCSVLELEKKIEVLVVCLCFDQFCCSVYILC